MAPDETGLSVSASGVDSQSSERSPSVVNCCPIAPFLSKGPPIACLNTPTERDRQIGDD